MQLSKRWVRRLGIVGITLLSVPWAAAQAVAEPTVESIDSCMRGNIPPSLQIKQFSLTSTDRNGANRLLKGHLYAMREKGLLRTMLRIDAPADLRGSSYLLREGQQKEQDAMFVFLPALNRTRRIMGGTQDNPLFGTDISYSDIKQISHVFSGGKVEVTRSEPFESHIADVLTLTPDPTLQSRFAQIITWVDRPSCVALRADFLAEGHVVKRYLGSVKDLRQSGSRWYVSKLTMEDLGEHSHTELTIDGVNDDGKLSDSTFNPQSFQLAN